ncbi:MAG: polysaccharide deacetylase family protein [Telmatospirillum sp.]|nr:polysaccharide deacetylase family protein [Telmatospirillum sp.]
MVAMSLGRVAKDLAFRTGAVAAWHRLVNRDTLTVVMFHRVLPESELRSADPGYTVSTTLFAQCLDFFSRHYRIISLDDLVSAIGGGPRLPPRALLITFDDGWDDNLRHAAPLLVERGLPALVFLATDPVSSRTAWWWQETLSHALREGLRSFADLWAAVPGQDAPPPPGPARHPALLVRYGALEEADRERILAPLSPAPATTGRPGRHMLTPERALRLGTMGIALGGHGAGHLPLSLLADPQQDLRRARQWLGTFAGETADRPVSLSFPHGRYSPRVAALAKECGFFPLFTSDAVLNDMRHGMQGDLIGRIEIPAHEISRPDGGLDPHRLASWLFLRPRRQPAS